MLGDLGSQFVAGWVGELITIGAAVSAFGCVLACVVGATRMLYALSRDEVGPAPLGTVSPRNGVPARSTAAIIIVVYAITFLCWFVLGLAPFDLFVAAATVGTLILLLVYALATIGAARLLFFSGERTGRRLGGRRAVPGARRHRLHALPQRRTPTRPRRRGGTR